MPDTASDQSLLEELDDRQDEILVALDDLNARIERLLNEYVTGRTESPTIAAS